MVHRTAHVAIAIVLDNGRILMVEQQGVDDPHPYWVLPGGLVEPGELLTEALVREVHEEAGIQIEDIAHLAYYTQIDHRLADWAAAIQMGKCFKWHGSRLRMP